MKTLDEIQRQINFPKFTDMFGNEIIPGDVIGMTNTGSRKIEAYFVTNHKTVSGNIILLNILHEDWRSRLDIKELSSKTSSCFQPITIVKLNDSLPAHLKEKAIQLKNNYIAKREKATKQAIINRQTAIQVRFFPVFAYNKNTKEFGIIFKNIQSKPGKVISAKDIKSAYIDLKNRFPREEYNLELIDKNHALIKFTEYSNTKPEMFSYNRSSYQYCSIAGYNFSLGNMVNSFEILNNHNYDLIDKFISIKKYNPNTMSVHDKKYGVIAVNNNNYCIENLDQHDRDTYDYVNLKYVFSNDVIKELERFMLHNI